MINPNDRIAFLIAGHRTGGDTRVVLNLVNQFAKKNLSVDLILASAAKIPSDRIPASIRIIDLQSPVTARTLSALKLLPGLIRYLRREKPSVLVANLVFTNAIVVLAKLLAFSPVKLVLVEHLALSTNASDAPQSRFILRLMRLFYPMADAVVSVSAQMAKQLETELHLDRNLKIIHNPVVDDALHRQAQVPLDHAWLQPNQPPVFLGVGRLAVQKDFETLIRAFALLREAMPARLIILGEGALHEQLKALIKELGIEADVQLPGFVANPYPYMRRASTFVLSSRWEALPTVLIEAIACRCQVVATDCPYGAREILDDGAIGQLVEIADPIALAQAMARSIQAPIDLEVLQQRAKDFSVDRVAAQYFELIDRL